MISGSRLPAVTLPSVPAGTRVDVRSGRGPAVVLGLHRLPCDGCARYLRRLRDALGQLREWGGRLLVVVPGDITAAESLGPASPPALTTGDEAVVLADEAGRVAGGAAFLAVADEWGDIHHRTDARDGHALPDPAEVVEWVRFVAIQCPECEGPEGPWRSMAEQRPASA